MARPEPLLNPPSRGWQRDLNAPNETPDELDNPFSVSHAPNHLDDVFLELSRTTLLVRGLVLFGGVATWVIVLITIICATFSFPPNELIWVFFLFIFILFWLGAAMISADISPPLDEPIRFNRQRRKIYVYRFHHCWWNPFARSRWGVKPEVHDWDNVRAEEVRVYVPGMTYNSGVVLSIVKPGTNEVIDRFPFSDSMQGGVPYWNMAVAYMQNGPSALPTFARPARDWNNEDPGFNLARRLAPKVHWPLDMDLESRTPPGQEHLVSAEERRVYREKIARETRELHQRRWRAGLIAGVVISVVMLLVWL